ncbi:MAG: 30S ribosome-binding factor RbfA [Holosporales bacterium]|nr:30S ribosome-binding factor RbfA [Holosporales bacterium]
MVRLLLAMADVYGIKKVDGRTDKRGRGKRADRVAFKIRECISDTILRDGLPNIPCRILTITHVDMSPDLRNSKIFVAPFNGELQEETISFLEEHKHYFKNVIAKKMNLKYVPEIVFKIDDSLEYSEKINKLLVN